MSLQKNKKNSYMENENVPNLKCKIGRYEITLLPEHQLGKYREMWKRYDRALGEIANILWRSYPGFTAIDIGANVGDSAALICNKYDIDILCVEGSNKFLPLLKENTSCFSSRVEIHPAFLGTPLIEELAEIESQYGTASIASKINSFEDKNSEHNTLADILKLHPHYSGFKLLKTDTDGMDFFIIKDSLNVIENAKPVIFFEYDLNFRNDAREQSAYVINELVKLGYKYFVVYDNFGNILTTVDCNYSRRFEELNDYLISNRKNGAVVYYYDVCAVNEIDKQLVEIIVDAANGKNEFNINDNSKQSGSRARSNSVKINEIEDFIVNKNYKAAADLISGLLDENPSDTAALNNLAVIQILTKDWEEASNTLSLILSIDKNNEVAASNLQYLKRELVLYQALIEAEKLIGNGEYEGAEKILNEILISNPNHIEALNDLAVVNIYKNSYEKALQNLKRVLEVDGMNEVALENFKQLESIIKENSLS